MLNQSHYSAVIAAPFGKIGLQVENKKLLALTLLSPQTSELSTRDPYTTFIIEELQRYFADPNHSFQIDIELIGTPFLKKVWKALASIPCGNTLTYGKFAKKLNTGPRAIGQACRRNPIPIIIPCHRIVGVGNLGGYSGELAGNMLALKKWLLTHEGVLSS